jgi:LmbE family N-acetylglucosaminyl deacetylase
LADTAELRLELVALVRRVQPDTVLCPDPTAVFFGEDYYNHRDHRVLGFAALDAIAPAAALPHYFPEAGPAHQVSQALMSGTLEPTVWVDIGDTIDAKVAAVSCHQSQFPDDGGWVGDVVRRRAAEEGRRCGTGFAEGFRRLRLGG